MQSTNVGETVGPQMGQSMSSDITEQQKTVLVVDLDGTLTPSDLLFESLWSALSCRTFHALRQIAQARGRADLKRRLADLAQIDVTRLPYRAEVLAYIERWRAAGGKTALVTASDHQIARRIADHLSVFDEVHGSDGRRNLKGAAKAAFLVERYGAGRYTYIGDAPSDLPVWQTADQAVLVNVARALTAKVEAFGRPIEHLGTPAGIGPWMRALRPHQWLKNILVFVPVVAGHVTDLQVLASSFAAFVVFCLVASSVYLMNDLLDLEADRTHPRKRNRSLAAGAIPIGPASILMGALLVTGLGLAALIGPLFLGVILAYYVMTTAYSLYLKERTIVDIWVLAMLYSMRVLAGVAATGIVPSVWLLAFSIFFFFSLAAVKRQAELVDLANRDTEAVMRRGYHRDDVILIAAMATAAGYVSVLIMALYVRTPDIDRLYSFPPALLGICLVLLYWISRIVMVTHRGFMHDDPLIFAVRDRVSQLCIACMLCFALLAAAL